MQRLLGILLISTLVAFGQGHKNATAHPDYVPDAKTAERIAEAVLIGQFGQERVNAQLPLQVTRSSKDFWLVEGLIPNTREIGGNFGVWVNKHDASVKVMERMK